MKTIAVVGMLMVLGASGAGAADIKGKWGIGAGVFGGGGEVSLIRGKSERSAWLFDVGFSQSYESQKQEISPPPGFPLGSTTGRGLSLLIGPGYRRFTRPTEEFSPYWDLRVRGLYSRTSISAGNGFIFTDAGAVGDFSMGLEYFTKWHFSVAAHTGLARARAVHSVGKQTDPVAEARTIRNTQVFSIGLSPALFVRGYF